MSTCQHVVGLILAGGLATRLQGRDKALLTIADRTLLARAVKRLGPQVDELALSSNAPAETYRGYQLPVIADVITGFQGPLAGIHAGLLAYPASCLLTVAVDLPFLPADLKMRLEQALSPGGCAYASVAGQHVLAVLWSPGMAGPLDAALHQDHHSLRRLLDLHGVPVEFPPDEDADLRVNINTPEDVLQAGRHPLAARNRSGDEKL
jgi:molybdopterin-guanine dinucleotide biosynthesis protein A